MQSFSNNLNAGNATATVSGKGNYTGTKAINFTIAKATMTVNSGNYSGTADGASHTITLNVTKPTSGITIYYSTSTSLTSSNYTSGSTTKPSRSDVGTTTVYWYVHSTNGNYADKNGSNTITIKERTVEESKGTVLSETKATTIKDTYGNSVVVPEGFKIASDSATDVTGGIVIEDVSHGSTTAGSQFVWIPVGEVKYLGGTKTINLDRYTFDSSTGVATAQGDKVINDTFQELATSSYGNTVAKDIETFKTSAVKNGGYYIGRYEARTAYERTSEYDSVTAMTVKPNDYIYNYINQSNAAPQARAMYNSTITSFTSDLINSYAWDTATLFLQEFDNRSSKTYVYSRQISLNKSLANKGTNNLSASQQDKICNVWDMASNNCEWTTETSTTYYDSPCVTRGGYYNSGGICTSSRFAKDTYYYASENYISFRIALYLKN